MAKVTRIRWCLLALLLLGVVSLAHTQRGVAETPPVPTGVSWNPNVNCVPVVTTFENIMGTNLNSFNGGLLAGSQYATYNLKYFDQNSTGFFQPGDTVVYDLDNNGTADVTPGKNDQFYSTVTSASADRNLSTSPTSLVSGSLVGKPLKTEPRLKYIDGSTTAYYNTTNGSWDAGEQNFGETVVFDANNDGVVDSGDTVVSGGVRLPFLAEIGKPLATQTFGGIFNKRMLNPPCTITNEFGQVVGVFVEIRGVYPVVWDYTTEDCASAFNEINGGGNFDNLLCDSSGNMQTFGIHGDCGGVIHTACGHRIHFEIDRDWMAKGWCGPGSSYCNNSTLPQYVASGSSGGAMGIDVQGFLYWDPTEVTTTGHSYSGWELHPFTAWRLSASLATTIEDSANNPVASIMAGTAVHDTAIISGSSGVYTGTVTYSVFTGSTCGGTGTIVGGPVTVINGVAPNSAPQTFDTPGSFSWNAVYSGDSGNSPATSSCEPLTVNKASPTISTSLSSNPITVGGSVTDSATLSNSFQASGTVVYSFFSGSSCAGTGTQVGSPVTVTSGAVPDSGSQTFNTAGGFSWNAVYSGDANNNGATSTCEPLTVNPASGVIITTTLSNNAIAVGDSASDSATLTGVTANAGGTVTYSFFSGSTCAGTGTPMGNPVTVANGVVPNSASQVFNTAGSFSWSAVYSGDANNGGATSVCEPLTVNKVSPTIATSLLSNPITVGGSVADSATLTNSFQAGGTVTFSFFTGPTCSGTGTIVGSPVTVTNGVVPDSASQTFNTAGSFSWNAVYSGDANNNGADSPCEPLTVNPPITANFAFSPTNPATGQKVIFSGSATGGTPPYVSWSWNFGDDSPPSFEATVAHSYSKAGSYTVQLTVTDSTGINATSMATITILEKRTIVGLDPTFFYELTTSLGVAVVITALGLYRKRTGRHIDSTV